MGKAYDEGYAKGITGRYSCWDNPYVTVSTTPPLYELEREMEEVLNDF